MAEAKEKKTKAEAKEPIKEQTAFEKLYAINVNDKTEKKNGLTYLSWAWGWAEFKKVYPDATYTVYKNEQGLPYVFDEKTGYMCYVSVTADGLTHEMWLPVMDGANKAMKDKPYEYATKYGKKSVEAATMFDVNKTIMRALVKCLAMFGLGLYIYSGEDLPEEETEVKQVAPTKVTSLDNPVTKVQADDLTKLASETGTDLTKLLAHYKHKDVFEMSVNEYIEAKNILAKRKADAEQEKN